MIGSALDFDALYQAQWHRMVRLALLLLGDRPSAEDAVQDAFISVHRRPPDDPAAAVAYLRTAVVNSARTMIRKRVVARRHLRVEVEQHAEAADHGLLVDAEYAPVLAALTALPRRQREVLVLRYWSELSFDEVAQTLGISSGTARSTASRALDALETTLGAAR